MLDIDLPSTIVKSNRLAGPTYCRDEAVVRAGQEAWCRLRSNATWDDWKQVGKAHVIGRHTAMMAAGTNQPVGRLYNEAFGRWRHEFGFENLDKGDRARLFEVMDRLSEIEAWLANLTACARLRLNHPNAVLRKWKAQAAVPNSKAAPRPSPYAQLKNAHAELIEENYRLAHELAAGGDLWTAQDTPEDIAKVMIRTLSARKVERVARSILAQLKNQAKDGMP